ncbi:MAG TPA: hypothetical protein GX008_08310 [Firmicutes bacterium]|jgi:hypothetical protein|nr:MAG: hypothetical protein AA931_09660 [Peptococcaceae bacterium 1109]HHT73702.1 hypothetical protein [Bacillota bacterium]
MTSRTLTPIALIRAEEWKAIIYYCLTEDTEHNYECPDEHAIVVWTTSDDETAGPSMHGAFNCETSLQTPGFVNVFWLSGNCDRPEGFAWEGNWSPHMARTRFMEMYEKALGKKYAGTRSENRG